MNQDGASKTNETMQLDSRLPRYFQIKNVGDKLLDTYCPSHCKAFLVLDHLYDILLICSRALYAGNVLFYSCERFAPGAFCFMTFYYKL